MGANLDYRIAVSVSGSAPPVERKGFGTILHITDDVTFAVDNIKTYENNADAQADDELGDTAKAAVATLFSQKKNPGRIKVAKVTAAYANVDDELDDIRAEDDDWYGLDFIDRAKANLAVVGAWALANGKLFMGQNGEADLLAATAGNIAETLKNLSNYRAAVIYHGDGDEHAALAWMAFKLQRNPDLGATTWADAPLAGITPDVITAAQRDNVFTNNGNVYLKFGGSGSTFPGKLADGSWIDEQITKDWIAARIAEDIAQLKKDVSARNEKIPYTALGLSMIESVAKARLLHGENIGVLREGESTVTVPSMADVLEADITGREATINIACRVTGAIEFFEFPIAVTP